jgi:hypothetical protein
MVKTPSKPPNPDNLVLTQLQGIRAEMSVHFEAITRLAEQVGRVVDQGAQIRAEIAGIRSDFARLQSDVVLLENHSLSRHGEIINILRRLEPIERVYRSKRAEGDDRGPGARRVGAPRARRARKKRVPMDVPPAPGS